MEKFLDSKFIFLEYKEPLLNKKKFTIDAMILNLKVILQTKVIFKGLNKSSCLTQQIALSFEL